MRRRRGGDHQPGVVIDDVGDLGQGAVNVRADRRGRPARAPSLRLARTSPSHGRTSPSRADRPKRRAPAQAARTSPSRADRPKLRGPAQATGGPAEATGGLTDMPDLYAPRSSGVAFRSAPGRSETARPMILCWSEHETCPFYSVSGVLEPHRRAPKPRQRSDPGTAGSAKRDRRAFAVAGLRPRVAGGGSSRVLMASGKLSRGIEAREVVPVTPPPPARQP
jgi:hypothetical protein